MKKIKKLLIITFCFALLLSTTTSTFPSDYEINPCGHHQNEPEKF